MPIFYTDIFGVSAAAMGTMFLVTKIWDAVNDPMMGVLADRSNTRWGKYRPFILYGSLPLAIAGVLTFTTPDLTDSGKLIYAYITYTLVMMLYTLVNVPYAALMGVMTSRYKRQNNNFIIPFRRCICWPAHSPDCCHKVTKISRWRRRSKCQRLSDNNNIAFNFSRYFTLHNIL